jgi:hypothetical protein
MIFDIEKNLQTFREDGVLILENYLDDSTSLKINAEIQPWLSKVSFNSHISSSVIGNNQWIEHLGLCSFHALETILHPNLISFAEQYLEEEISLGSLQFQRKIFAESTGIPMHRDYGKGIYFFIFLNGADDSTGATRFIKKSHLISMSEDRFRSGETKELYMDEAFIQNHQEDILQATGGPGTMVVWDRGIAHDLPNFKKHGRELIMASLLPQSESPQKKDHLFRQSIIKKLSIKQKEVIFSGEQSGERNSLVQLGLEKSLLDDYGISRFKMLMYYFKFQAAQIIRQLFRI